MLDVAVDSALIVMLPPVILPSTVMPVVALASPDSSVWLAVAVRLTSPLVKLVPLLMACALISAYCMIEIVGASSVTLSAFFCEKPKPFRKRVSMTALASSVIELLALIVNVRALAAARIRLAIVSLLTKPVLPELLSPVGPI